MDEAKKRELTTPIRSQADLCGLWERLMQPLGFASRSIWLTFLTDDRLPVPSITEIAECDVLPAEHEVDNLFTMVAEVIASTGMDASVCMLVTRPGPARVEREDRELARRLVDGARRSGVPLEPVHLAGDTGILALTPDDLAA